MSPPSPPPLQPRARPERPRVAFAACVAALAVFVALFTVRRGSSRSLPAHLLGNPVRVFPALLDDVTQAELVALTRALRVFPTVTGAEANYTIAHEDIGEGFENSPLKRGGRAVCAHPLLLLSPDGQRCILPGRADVGRHYIATGGWEGLREQHADLLSRVQSFSRYVFEPRDHAVTARLFSSPHFLEAARSVCPAHKPVLDPFQMNLILQVPGQTVPTHVDGVWFWGASRFRFPQWLLACMVFSGAFQGAFIDQVQLVAYFTEPPGDASDGVPVSAAGGGSVNATRGPRRGGEFVHWSDGSPHSTPCTPGSGNAMDGSKTVHAAAVFEPSGPPPPLLSKDEHNALEYDAATDEWVLVSDTRPRARWPASALRNSVVYRARCFADEAERARFHQELATGQGAMDLEVDILSPLKDELVRLGHARSRADVDALSRLNLALALMDAFTAYPSPAALIPFNYCALNKLFPDSPLVASAIDYLCPVRATRD